MNMNKMDAGLRKLVEESEKINSMGKIAFLAKCNTDIDKDLLKRIRNTGVKISTMVMDIFTAAGSYSAIKLLAEEDFIVKLEASKEYSLD